MRPDDVPARAPLPPLGDIATLVAWLLPPPHDDAALIAIMWIGIAVRARDEQMRVALEEEVARLPGGGRDARMPMAAGAGEALRDVIAMLGGASTPVPEMLGAPPGDPVAVAPETTPALRARVERLRKQGEGRTLGFWLTEDGATVRKELAEAERELARREAPPVGETMAVGGGENAAPSPVCEHLSLRGLCPECIRRAVRRVSLGEPVTTGDDGSGS